MSPGTWYSSTRCHTYNRKPQYLEDAIFVSSHRQFLCGHVFPLTQAAEGFCHEHGLDEAMRTVLMPQLIAVSNAYHNSSCPIAEPRRTPVVITRAEQTPYHGLQATYLSRSQQGNKAPRSARGARCQYISLNSLILLWYHCITREMEIAMCSRSLGEGLALIYANMLRRDPSCWACQGLFLA